MARILVIDDDPALRGVMRRILEREGHTVLEADDGVRGVELVEEAPPDAVVTDLLMPEKEGIETIMELRERFPDVPIVAVSGAGGEGGGPLVDAELLGASVTLSKPFTVEDFARAVESVLNRAE